MALGQDQVTLGFVYGSFAPQEKWELYFEDFLAEHPNVTINYIPVPLDSWGDYTRRSSPQCSAASRSMSSGTPLKLFP